MNFALLLHLLWRFSLISLLILGAVYFTMTFQKMTPVAQCGIVSIDMIVRNSALVSILWTFFMFAESQYFYDKQQFAKHKINLLLIALSTLIILGFIASVYIPALYITVYGWML